MSCGVWWPTRSGIWSILFWKNLTFCKFWLMTTLWNLGLECQALYLPDSDDHEDKATTKAAAAKCCFRFFQVIFCKLIFCVIRIVECCGPISIWSNNLWCHTNAAHFFHCGCVSSIGVKLQWRGWNGNQPVVGIEVFTYRYYSAFLTLPQAHWEVSVGSAAFASRGRR
jgi:hypothetical protein